MFNQLKTVLLLGALSTLLVVIGGVLGRDYVGLFFGLAVLLNIGAYFFSDKLVLAMHGAREVSAEEAPVLHRIVADVAKRACLPMPRVCIVPSPQPNAFATGRNPAHGVVAVTEGILGLLSERELRGVLAHEVGHIKNREILVSTIAAILAAAITQAAHVLQWGAYMSGGRRGDDDGPSPLGQLALALVAPFAAMLLQLGVSRSREYLADETGAQVSDDPEALASALEKLARGAARVPMPVNPATANLFIVNPMLGQGGLLSLFSTHPAMEERIRRLRAMASARRAAPGANPFMVR